jgi:aminoglycoside 3-N-acetyltransferase I
MKFLRLQPGDTGTARALFAVMSDVFGEDRRELSEAYVARLLERPELWAIAAVSGDEVVGGLTAHTLPMTRTETSEVFLYDLAVRRDHQRQGVGRRLVAHLLEAAAAVGIEEVFVPADNEDGHALDFYRALGGSAAAVTIFTFAPGGPHRG